jgi:hypothetical protein
MSVTKMPKTWSQLKQLIECSRKFIFAINNDTPTNISFRECVNCETGQKEFRVYFLAGTQKRDITIKYITIRPNEVLDQIAGQTIFMSNASNMNEFDKKLTKEEQLLRERKRCSFNGITSYSMNNSGRFVFSERSELFYFDDEVSTTSSVIIQLHLFVYLFIYLFI